MKLFSYVVSNAMFAAALVFGTVYNVEMAANVVKFLTCVMFFAAVVISFLPGKDLVACKVSPTVPDVVPEWVDQIYDMAITVMMAAHGWFLFATLYFFHIIAFGSVRRKIEDYKNSVGGAAV